MSKGTPQTAEDVEGSWQDPGFDSSLIKRCRDNWHVPVTDLPNAVLSTFLRQKIAFKIVIPEAKRRIEADIHDASELYYVELKDALNRIEKPD